MDHSEKYTLYYHPISPPSRTCKLFLDHLKIPYKLHVINYKAKENRSKEYLKKNPFTQFPTLGIERGNEEPVYVYESFAILKYLSSKYTSSIFSSSDK